MATTITNDEYVLFISYDDNEFIIYILSCIVHCVILHGGDRGEKIGCNQNYTLHSI